MEPVTSPRGSQGAPKPSHPLEIAEDSSPLLFLTQPQAGLQF